MPSLPPVEEQRRIVTRIEHLAHKIEEARYLRDRASKERNVLIISVHQNLAGKRVKKLGEILTLEEHAEPVLPTGAYPQVGIRSFGLGLFPKPAVEGTKTTYRAFNRVYTGALILSQVKGWEGAVAVCPPELAGWFASPEYRTFRCIPTEARPGYLAPIVRTEWFWRRLASATRGVGARRERTRPEQFLEIEVPMPDVKQQEKGEALFLQLERIQSLQTEADLGLGGILASVLERAFQGEL
jgi:type I restriction enzyme, S subunit